MNSKKSFVAIATVMGLALPLAAHAADDAPAPPPSWLPGSFTANVALTSDYVFRGVSQSDDNVAVQGGMDWDTGYGLHFGTWASSINFKDGNEGTTEVDLYGGYAGKVGDHVTYDLGFIRYWYPGAASSLHYNLWEIYGKAAYDFGIAAVNVGVNYSPDNFGGTGDAVYYSSGLSVPIGSILTVSGALDYYDLQAPATNYWDWNLGAKLNVNNWFNVDVRYYDTDTTGGCLVAGKKLCGSKAVVSVSRTF